MRWVVETDLPAYGRRVLPWLERDPVENNVLCTTIRLRLGGAMPDPAPPLLAWLDGGDGAVAGAALRTPPFDLVLPALPPRAVRALADRLRSAGADLPGATGPVGSVDRFAGAWTERTGGRADVRFHERLYRLVELTPPAGVPGRLRRAGEADLPLLVRWTSAFDGETGLAHAPDVQTATRRRIARGGAHLWTVDGEPTCLVGSALPVCGVVRIGPVYTPPAHRRRGYASAATAAVSRHLLDAGAHTCVLYTDLANPTSNAVYQRIGYRPVSDHRSWVFAPG